MSPRFTVNTSKANLGALRHLLEYIWLNYKVQLFLIALCILISSAASLVSTLFIKSLIDDYIKPLTQQQIPDFSPLALALSALACILLVGAGCSYAYNLMSITISQALMRRFRFDMFRHMQKLPIRFFDTKQIGDIMSAYTNDVDSLREMTSRSLPSLINSIITIVAVLVSMVVLSVPLTLVSLFITGVVLLVTTTLGNKARKYFRAQQQKLAEENAFIEEMISGQKAVKVFCHEQEAYEQFEALNEELRQSVCSANKIANVVMPIVGNLGTLGYVLIAVAGAYISVCTDLSLSLGTLVSFLTLNKNFMQPFSQFSQQINSVINASVGAERIFNLLDEEPEVDEGKRKLMAEDVRGEFRMRNVSFGYTRHQKVLHDICLDVKANQTVALVGDTGAGKTSIFGLLTRFYEYQEGEVLLDGRMLRDYTKDSLRQNMGIVQQETHLFSGTVLDNVRYGRPHATLEECRRAARQLGVESIILRMKDGYDTYLDNAGANLSLGERQLLTLVRTAVADPRILFMDEATSSIDSRTEQIVQQGMIRLMQGRTTFVIAHRLSTVRNADLICVMRDGRIVERGTHEELIRARGFYWQMCQ